LQERTEIVAGHFLEQHAELVRQCLGKPAAEASAAFHCRLELAGKLQDQRL